jgi:hypothetical protein
MFTPWPWGWSTRKRPGRERSLGARGLLHHLDQDLLAGFQQLRDPGTALSEAQGAEIGDVNETVFLAFADIHKGGVDTRQYVLDGAEVDVTDLVAALGHHQLIDTFVVEHGGDPQLLSDDDLLGHGGKVGLSGALPVGRRRAAPEDQWGSDRSPGEGSSCQKGQSAAAAINGLEKLSDRHDSPGRIEWVKGSES